MQILKSYKPDTDTPAQRAIDFAITGLQKPTKDGTAQTYWTQYVRTSNGLDSEPSVQRDNSIAYGNVPMTRPGG